MYVLVFLLADLIDQFAYVFAKYKSCFSFSIQVQVKMNEFLPGPGCED